MEKMKSPTSKPEVSSGLAQRELDKAEKQFEAFDENIKSMTFDRMNMAPKEEVEPQTKLSQKEVDKIGQIYLKPVKSIGSSQKFNEAFRAEYEFRKEYVCFIAENKEVIGETIEKWTRPYGGMAAEFWQVPVNKPVWGPRYLAEELATKSYHRMVMDDTSRKGNMSGSDGLAEYYGVVAVDQTIDRLSATPYVANKKSIFMGTQKF